jgi:hypothetical protein
MRIRCHSFTFAAVVGRQVADADGQEGALNVRVQLSDMYTERLAAREAEKALARRRAFKGLGTGAPVTTGSKSHFETKASQNDERFEGDAA